MNKLILFLSLSVVFFQCSDKPSSKNETDIQNGDVVHGQVDHEENSEYGFDGNDSDEEEVLEEFVLEDILGADINLPYVKKNQGLDIEELKNYKKLLSQLPTKEQSLLDGLNLFVENFDKDNPEYNDKALLVYLDFQQELISKLSPNQNKDEDFDAFKERVGNYGIFVGSDEGEMYFAGNPAIAFDYFGSYLTEPTKEYLKYQNKEVTEKYAEDGGIMIEISDLGDRILFYDKFYHTYPNHFFARDARKLYNFQIYALMTGLDNTNAFSGEEDSLKKDFHDVYLFIGENFPDSRTGKLMKFYLELLEKNNFKKTNDVSRFHSLF